MATFPQVGSLYNHGFVNGLPTFTQPGGVGTTVFPQQAQISPANFQGYIQYPMAYPGQYYPSCGHVINTFDVFFEYNASAGEIYALICCPFCSFIQVVMPESQYYSYLQTPVVVA